MWFETLSLRISRPYTKLQVAIGSLLRLWLAGKAILWRLGSLESGIKKNLEKGQAAADNRSSVKSVFQSDDNRVADGVLMAMIHRFLCIFDIT